MQSFYRVTKPKTREIRGVVGLWGTSNSITPQQSPSFSTQSPILTVPYCWDKSAFLWTGLLGRTFLQVVDSTCDFPSFLSIALSSRLHRPTSSFTFPGSTQLFPWFELLTVYQLLIDIQHLSRPVSDSRTFINSGSARWPRVLVAATRSLCTTRLWNKSFAHDNH